LLQNKEDRLKCIEVLSRIYLRDIEVFIPTSEEQSRFRDKLVLWKGVIRQMQVNRHKVELESFFNEMPPEWIEHMFDEEYSI
jgi:hypothetical protein